MKVLLISHPNAHRQKPDFPPIGIAYLGAMVKNHGHEVLLVDGGISPIGEIVRFAKEFSPDFIGITCWTINRGIVWALCSQLKKNLPNTFLAIGGPHASFYPEHIFAKTHAYAVVIGEGEETICELLDALKNGGALAKIKGIAFKRENGTVQLTEKRPLIETLDAISFPFYEGFKNFNFKNYLGFAGLPRPTAAIVTSRGCVFDCTYCGSVNFWGRNWRHRSAQNVLDEIEHLVKEMGARSIFIFDDNFPVNKKRAMDICQGIVERKLNIQWACCSHVKMVNEELLNAMNISGCVNIDFGVESGSNLILENINKKQKRSDIESAFAMAHRAGIKPRAYLMIGNKGETTETIDETIEMIGKIKPHSSIGASILWLLPGTSVYNDAKIRGFIDDNFWLKSDDVPYNLQEYSYGELFKLRSRLMFGIAKKKGGILSLIICYLKIIYYKYPKLSFLRVLIPGILR